MADTELIDHTGRVVFRGTQKPPGGGSQTLEEVLTAGSDGGAVGMTNTGSIDTGGATVSASDVNASGTVAAVGVAVDTVSASGDAEIDGVLSVASIAGIGVAPTTLALAANVVDFNAGSLANFNDLTPTSPPEVPASPSVQDVVDALVGLNLITQAS